MPTPPTSADLATGLLRLNPEAVLLEPRSVFDPAIAGLRWRGGRRLCARYDFGRLIVALRTSTPGITDDQIADRVIELFTPYVGDASCPFVHRARKGAPPPVPSDYIERA